MSSGHLGQGNHACSWSKRSADAELSPDPTMVVQSTRDTVEYNPPSTWTRVSLRPVSKLSTWMIEWAIHPWKVCRDERQPSRRLRLMVCIMTVLRLSIMLIPFQLLSSLGQIYNDPIASKISARRSPLGQTRYTRNELDRGQKRTANTPGMEGGINGAVGLFKSTRLVLPQRLVLYADKSWMLVKDPAPTTEYLFISWHWESFKYDRNKPSNAALSLVKKMAQHATLEAGLKAYWLDVQCVDQKFGESFSSDVYGMADVVRNANHVAILLPSEHSFYKRSWARRLWTLPEGLLAKGKLRIWTATENGLTKNELDRVEMTYEFWHPFAHDERHYPTRILAEYYEGQIELTRLEMIVTAIAALSRQDSSKFTDADIAYALMGLLGKRMAIERSDTLHQAMTKLLSLTGENEYVMERMLSSYPFPAKDFNSLLKCVLNKDQFGTCLWDIRSSCEIVGLDDIDGVVYLNNCRTLPVCHQHIPDQAGEIFRTIELLRSTATLLLCLFTYGFMSVLAPGLHTAYAVLLCTSILCLQHPPTMGSIADGHEFVLIEGVMPLSQLEEAVFGNVGDTLTYATSSSPLTATHYDNDPPWVESANLKRWTKELYTARKSGNEPVWIQTAKPGPTPTSPVSPISPLLRQVSGLEQPQQEAYHPPLLAGYTVFTLIRMSTRQVSLVQSRLPPTSLLLTGEEGGMVRAVLCSSVYDGDGLEVFQKEALLRLDPEVWDVGHPRSWLRVKML